MYRPKVNEFCYRIIEGRIEPFVPIKIDMWNYGYSFGKRPLYIDKDGRCSRAYDIYKTREDAETRGKKK